MVPGCDSFRLGFCIMVLSMASMPFFMVQENFRCTIDKETEYPIIVRAGFFAGYSQPGHVGIYNRWFDTTIDGQEYQFVWMIENAGGKVIKKLDNNELQISCLGSSPWAFAAARKIPITMIHAGMGINFGEMLLVRDSLGIITPRDLIGKKVGTIAGSTVGFHSEFMVKVFNLPYTICQGHEVACPRVPDKVTLVLAGSGTIVNQLWDAQEIDGAFMWGWQHVAANGGIPLVTSGMLGQLGQATFNNVVARNDFMEAHPKLVAHVLRVFTILDMNLLDHPEQWRKDSKNLKMTGLVADYSNNPESYPYVPVESGGPRDWDQRYEVHVYDTTKSFYWYTFKEQRGCVHLADPTQQQCTPAYGGAALATSAQSQFAFEQKKTLYYPTPEVARRDLVTPKYLIMAEEMTEITLESLGKNNRPYADLFSGNRYAGTPCTKGVKLSATAGTISDGHATGGPYLRNMDCDWLIEGADAGSLIDLSFPLFSAERDADWLYVYEGTSANPQKLLGALTGRLSQTNSPIPSFRGTGALFITWKTDGTFDEPWINPEENGFTATFKAGGGCLTDADCGGVAKGNCDVNSKKCICKPGRGGGDCAQDACFGATAVSGSGTLKSSESSFSRNNANCLWVLTADPGKSVLLQFKKFALDEAYDKVTLTDAETGTPLGVFSGKQTAGMKIKTASTKVNVEFKSDAVIRSSAFELIFTSESASVDCTSKADCSGNGVSCP
eukprot:g2687.t1